MVRIIKKPEEIFGEFTKDHQTALGDNLESIILYGSGASGDYVPGRSNLNFLIVLKKVDLSQLRLCAPLIRKWGKRGVAIPIFLTRQDINSSTDVFSIEFLEIKENHTVVYGEDAVKDLPINIKNLRLQCEREIRGQLIRLRGAFLEAFYSQKQMEDLAGRSLTSFLPILRNLFRLLKMKMPSRREEIVEATVEKFSLNREVFSRLLALKKGQLKLKKLEMEALMEDYLEEIQKLAGAIDRLKV